MAREREKEAAQRPWHDGAREGWRSAGSAKEEGKKGERGRTAWWASLAC
jgi:hypothetical protein